jgi:hypothetical protein
MWLEGEKYHLQKGGGVINIVFGPKYRPQMEKQEKLIVKELTL